MDETVLFRLMNQIIKILETVSQIILHYGTYYITLFIKSLFLEAQDSICMNFLGKMGILKSDYYLSRNRTL